MHIDRKDIIAVMRVKPKHHNSKGLRVPPRPITNLSRGIVVPESVANYVPKVER